MAFNSLCVYINRHPSGSMLSRRGENKTFIKYTITILCYIPRTPNTCYIILVTGRYPIIEFLFFNHSSCLSGEIIYLLLYSADTVIKQTHIERSYFYVSIYIFNFIIQDIYIHTVYYILPRVVLSQQYKRCYRYRREL